MGNKPVVFLAGAARSHTPMSTIYLHSGYSLSWGDILMTLVQCTGKYYVHTQSGRTLYATPGVSRPMQPL